MWRGLETSYIWYHICLCNIEDVCGKFRWCHRVTHCLVNFRDILSLLSSFFLWYHKSDCQCTCQFDTLTWRYRCITIVMQKNSPFLFWMLKGIIFNKISMMSLRHDALNTENDLLIHLHTTLITSIYNDQKSHRNFGLRMSVSRCHEYDIVPDCRRDFPCRSERCYSPESKKWCLCWNRSVSPRVNPIVRSNSSV